MTRPARIDRPRITLERTFDAPIEDVWELWTTAEGIESWWGPDGFCVTVEKLELRPGGELRYAMIATAPDKVAFMQKAGMPLTQRVQAVYTEVDPPRRLGFNCLADFIPGVEPYEVATTVELHAGADGVRMVLAFDAMHDEIWTRRATMGWESELEQLRAQLDRRSARA